LSGFYLIKTHCQGKFSFFVKKFVFFLKNDSVSLKKISIEGKMNKSIFPCVSEIIGKTRWKVKGGENS